MSNIIKQAIFDFKRSGVDSRRRLAVEKRRLAKKHGLAIFTNSSLLREYNKMLVTGEISRSPELENILRKRAVRTLSGVAPVAVLTKFHPCPGKCVYCPDEKNVPKSYLSNEPAVMRAIRCGYDPYKQVQQRLKALEANGHKPEKIELIVIGGTWSVLPEKYKFWFIRKCFRGANDYGRKKPEARSKKTRKPSEKLKKKTEEILLREQKKNEKAKYRIIGITVETRPDYIDEKELWQMRELGVTRVELGVQAVDDKILSYNKRGHGVDKIARATKLLKNFGFKATYHIMPGLPGSTPAKDLKMFKALFSDERFQPDQLKFYPTVVTRGSLLYRWWRAGKYKPYSDRSLKNLIIKCKAVVPPYVRIIRLIRDIPGESIIAGNKITNLRQVMRQNGVKCRCIRCREAGSGKLEARSQKLEVIEYAASGGREYFLQYTDKTGKILYGFCRLRLSLPKKAKKELDSFSAMIRELHVYGELVPVGAGKKVQHAGLGRELMAEAERIARVNGYNKIAVIAGVGVRNYYRNLGFRLRNTYMVKICG